MHFVMKLSKLCNLRCTYCYEYDELADPARMPLDGVDRFFAGVAEAATELGWRRRLTFVLHGGEPLLLPTSWLREFFSLGRRHLEPAGIPHRFSLQTNLVKLDNDKLALLEEFDVSLGVSLDVFGDQRLRVSGKPSQPHVLRNLQRVLDSGAAERLGLGTICVLHAGNVDRVRETYAFQAQLGISYRILPIFSMTEPPARMRHLVLTPEQVVAAFEQVADLHFAAGSGINVYPLAHYVEAAVRSLAGVGGGAYDPSLGEWALIVNTNGDAYDHGDAYSPEGYLGNVFRSGLVEILAGEDRGRALALRAQRAALCDACPHGAACSRLPVVEALPSERHVDASGEPRCAIARPMIDAMIRRIRANPETAAALERAAA